MDHDFFTWCLIHRYILAHKGVVHTCDFNQKGRKFIVIEWFKFTVHTKTHPDINHVNSVRLQSVLVSIGDVRGDRLRNLQCCFYTESICLTVTCEFTSYNIALFYVWQEHGTNLWQILAKLKLMDECERLLRAFEYRSQIELFCIHPFKCYLKAGYCYISDNICIY